MKEVTKMNDKQKTILGGIGVLIAMVLILVVGGALLFICPAIMVPLIALLIIGGN
jgi:hypothetical protein